MSVVQIPLAILEGLALHKPVANELWRITSHGKRLVPLPDGHLRARRSPEGLLDDLASYVDNVRAIPGRKAEARTSPIYKLSS